MLSKSLLRPAAARSVLRSLAGRDVRAFADAAPVSDGVRGKGETGKFMKDGLLQFETISELQIRSAEQWPDRNLFGTYDESAQAYGWMSYRDFDAKVSAARGVLTELGIKKGESVGVISNNRWEWAATAAACYSLSAVMVPMYEAQLPSDWEYILNDAGCSALMCANQDIFDRAASKVKPNVPTLKNMLVFDALESEPHAFANLMATYSSKDTPVFAPSPEDLANLIYTSGTTGKPKGVELTHANQISNITGVRTMVEDPLEFMRIDDRSLSFLPWAHSYGQTCELWSLMAHGSSMGICRGVPHILEDLQMVKPSILFSVPTLYKRVYDGVQNMIETTNPIRRTLMKKALTLGAEKAKLDEEGRSLGMMANWQYSKLDGLVLSKIRDRFGGNLRHGFVAGAACPAEIIDFMDSIGVPVCEGYGLTETSPVVAINSPERRKIGSVGQAITGVEVLVIGDEGQPLPKGQEGEICVVGPNIMKGYHNKPEATDEVITVLEDGRRMFHTGDLGRVGLDDFVSITGRLKEQYKLENGKYVVPTPVEEAIGMSRFIMQMVLCGANRPHNVALLVPDVDAIKAELKLDGDVSLDDLMSNPNAKTLIDNEIAANSSSLKKFEVPTKWHLVPPFTVENNMLTPKMSVRRHMAIRAYEAEIGAMYGDQEAAEATA